MLYTEKNPNFAQNLISMLFGHFEFCHGEVRRVFPGPCFYSTMSTDLTEMAPICMRKSVVNTLIYVVTVDESDFCRTHL